jgi:hypothetical protein
LGVHFATSEYCLPKAHAIIHRVGEWCSELVGRGGSRGVVVSSYL